ncbi:17620_t:CDS:10 [Entrophospora sp. SA101]|nr:17620_t:CDS:10 [Entrophospora sp. SA101]
MATSYPRIIRGITVDRLDKFTSPDYFSDVNLYSQLYKNRVNPTTCEGCIELAVFSVPDLKRVTFEEAKNAHYKPSKLGESFGPSWSTHWFRVNVQIPNNWVNEEVQLLWNANNEGMVWTIDGLPLQGLTGGGGDDRRVEYVLTKNSKGGDKFEFYIEMACNGMFGNADNGGINPPNPNRYFKLETLELVVRNEEAWNLFYDFQIIRGVVKDLPANSVRSAQALTTANSIINKFQLGNDESIKECRKIAKKFFENKNGSSQHNLIAVGHCHIDTAWLWPFDETKRKVARSWSTQIGLMDQYPDYKFVCSQAQQYEWLKDYYPNLFERVKEKATNGQFLPIGGTWVEMDCNIPSGESFCRQFLYGQRFFEKTFGKKCKVFWLPDTFGYSAQLPQIIQSSGMKYFFTQKLSWNNINKFPNTTFHWIGLDGSKVLTHMCPSETYVAQCTVGELVKSVNNHNDKEYSNESLLVFGNGDGGGGPLSSMIERLNRLKDIDGLPKVEMGSADEFYERLEKNSKELIGTYTSHGYAKKYNRKCELLLRDVELLSTISYYTEPKDNKYPKKALDKLWKIVLLNQFHDVLPGSSIEMVYDDAYKFYEEVEKVGNELLKEVVDDVLKVSSVTDSTEKGLLVFNTLSWPRAEIVKIPACNGLGALQQHSKDKESGYVLEIKINPVKVFEVNDEFYCLENEFLSVKIDKHGRITKIIPEGKLGNVFRIFEDIPIFWDAWDAGLGVVQIHEEGPFYASLLLKTNLTRTSSLEQVISLSAVSRRLDFETKVDWNENRQFLKVEFPFDINSDYATYETQFGFIQRPTHYNTSWDYAKFEVCGHKFADLSEYGYGVALMNDCKYGYSTHDNVMRLSLLRSPKAPDANCDICKHEFKYAILPHNKSFLESNVVKEAFVSKETIRKHESKSYFSIENAPNVILDTVKRAEDSNEIVLRLYEAYGGHAKAKLKSLCLTNILEEKQEAIDYNVKDGSIIKFKPFQIITLKATLR